MPTASEIVRDLVTREEGRVTASWPHPERRLALLEICRAIDIVVLSAKHQREEVVELCRRISEHLFVPDDFMDRSQISLCCPIHKLSNASLKLCNVARAFGAIHGDLFFRDLRKD